MDDFDLRRLRRADQIVAGGAIALLIFMFFFKWYGVSSNLNSIAGVNVNISRNGWNTFTNSRWVWLITILVALGAVVLAALARKLEGPVQPGVLVAGLGALSTALIFYRIVHHPTASASFGGFHASVGIKIGIWLGLIAAAVITYGGYLQMQAEGTSLADLRGQAGDAFSGLTASPGAPTAPPGPQAGAPTSAPAPPAPADAPPPPPASPAPPEHSATPPPATPPSPPSAAPAPSATPPPSAAPPAAPPSPGPGAVPGPETAAGQAAEQGAAPPIPPPAAPPIPPPAEPQPGPSPEEPPPSGQAA